MNLDKENEYTEFKKSTSGNKLSQGSLLLKSVLYVYIKILKSVLFSIIIILKNVEGNMLYRKIAALIEEHLTSDTSKVLLIDGARQVGKSYIIRYVGNKLYKNYIEIDMQEDKEGDGLFSGVKTIEDFYLAVSMIHGDKLGSKKDTLIFIDEIQTYPNLLTLLKFLVKDDRYTYIASGSLLGITLKETSSIPMGSIRKVRMFPLDFEEFLYANGVSKLVIDTMYKCFKEKRALEETMHDKLLDLFKKYLLVGGLPDAVNEYINTKNIQRIREIQNEIREYYAIDAAKYSDERRLKIMAIYDLIPSNMENKKKRVVYKDIEGKKGKRHNDYEDEFDYLLSSGIALGVKAISEPRYPLIQSTSKNLIKLYYNDVGLLTSRLYGNNIRAILDDDMSINLGSVYETVVCSELIAHGHDLYYYDNRLKGEVDYLIEDQDKLSVLPIEVKSGKDYTVHSALNNLLSTKEYNITEAYVLSNSSKLFTKNNITYLPIYLSQFL